MRFLLVMFSCFGLVPFSFAQNPEPAAQIKVAGFFNTTELNFSRAFLNKYSFSIAGLQNVSGYRFNEHIATGIGIGLEKAIQGNIFNGGLTNGSIFLPVFSDVRIYFGKNKLQPYFGQAAGYMFCIYQPGYNAQNGRNNNIGGLMLNPSFGLSSRLSSGKVFHGSIGYRLQEETIKNLSYFQDSFDPDYNYRPNKITVSSHLLSLKAGLTF